MGKGEFVRRVNEEFANGGELADGYAPFCKHFFVRNWTPARVGCLKITDENRGLLQSGYSSRTPKELPVLERWFPKESLEAPVADYLDVILYSREQVELESKQMQEEFTLGEGVEWGIVSVKAQMENFETPMQPITVLRNALGTNEGGSGVPLCREKYMQS